MYSFLKRKDIFQHKKVSKRYFDAFMRNNFRENGPVTSLEDKPPYTPVQTIPDSLIFCRTPVKLGFIVKEGDNFSVHYLEYFEDRHQAVISCAVLPCILIDAVTRLKKENPHE